MRVVLDIYSQDGILCVFEFISTGLNYPHYLHSKRSRPTESYSIAGNGDINYIDNLGSVYGLRPTS